MRFEIVLEPQETRLEEALARLKTEMNLPGRIGDMATEIKQTAKSISSLWDTDVWADASALGELGKRLREDTKNALRDHMHLKSAREARQLTDFIWSPRQNRRGRSQEINSELLTAVLECVERIAGQRLSYSRKRARRAPPSVSTSGPPEGAMMDVLLAALDWAYALPGPQQKSVPLKVEGVLSAVKRLRRQPGQN